MRTIVICMLIGIIACGCVPKEPEPEECNYCVILGDLLEASMGNTEKAIEAGQKLSASKDELQTELLKANTEIAKCWGIIESSKPDPNTPPVWGKGDPDANWQRYFGNGNLARLNSAQTQKIDLQGNTLADLIGRVSKLEAEREALKVKVDEMFAVDHEKLNCKEFYAYAEELVNKMIEKSKKTTELIHARLDVLEESAIIDDVNEPVTHCNEDSGCGWAYWKCSLHSRTSVDDEKVTVEKEVSPLMKSLQKAADSGY